MWTYKQSTGILTASDGTEYDGGYSGHGEGVNTPSMQDVPDVGPIPQGFYTIANWHTDPEKGPLVAELIPDAENEMFGRSGFLMHGDLVGKVGLRLASHGCIIEPHGTRMTVHNSGDGRLQVIT